VPPHSDDPSSSDPAAIAPPALADELTAAMPVLPGSAATGNGNDVTTMTAACNFQATDAGDMTRNGPRLSGTYVYGYDSGFFSDRTPGTEPGRDRSGMPRRRYSALRPASGARRAEKRTKPRRCAPRAGASLRAPPGRVRAGDVREVASSTRSRLKAGVLHQRAVGDDVRCCPFRREP
jgi:hypothetical protein